MNKFIDVLTKVFSAKVFRWVWLAAMFVAAVSDNLGMLVAAAAFYAIDSIEYKFENSNLLNVTFTPIEDSEVAEK